MAAGFVTLGQIATGRSVMDIACNRCDRRGRLRIPRLIAEHGADLPVPELRRIVAADCSGCGCKQIDSMGCSAAKAGRGCYPPALPRAREQSMADG